MLRRGNYRPVRGRVRKLIVLESGQATGVAALAEMPPDAIRQRKRAVRVTNGPSLGRKRPRRATTYTSRARDVAPQNLRVHCTIFKCNFCRAACTESEGSAEALRNRGLLDGRRRGLPDGKKAVRSPNGPSLGRKRPKWAAVVVRSSVHRAIRHMTLFAHNGKLTARRFVQCRWMCSGGATV
jgi:hypothetical protein